LQPYELDTLSFILNVLGSFSLFLAFFNIFIIFVPAVAEEMPSQSRRIHLFTQGIEKGFL